MTVDFTVKYKQKNDILVYNCNFKRLAFFSHFEISIHIKIYKAAYPQVPIQARIQKIFAGSSRDIFVFCGGGGGGCGPCLLMRIL